MCIIKAIRKFREKKKNQVTDEQVDQAIDEAKDLVDKIQDMVGDVGLVDAVNDDAETAEWKPTVLINFDGVIHSYTSGWKGASNIPDEPISYTIRRSKRLYTSIDWLTELVNDGSLDVNIFSSRNHQAGGIKAMKDWLKLHGMDSRVLAEIKFPTDKPPSLLLIDYRAVQFKGEFWNAQKIKNFKPWKTGRS